MPGCIRIGVFGTELCRTLSNLMDGVLFRKVPGACKALGVEPRKVAGANAGP